MNFEEVVLSVLPGNTEHDRVVLVLCHNATGSHVELRQQSFGAGVGWFNQATIHLEPEQVADLRRALGAGPATAALPKTMRQVGTARNTNWSPKVVTADSA